jgi:ABC-type nitrate/sulfonate/bicarbonate transport system substrate-binding protein
VQRLRRRLVLALVILELFILRPAIPAAAADKLDKLRIAYVSPIGAMAPIWMAAASSAFHTEGLDVELVMIQASAAIAAIVAGEVDAVQISAPGIVPVVLAGGNITMIAGLLNKMIFSFHAQKEFKSAEQLRGKLVGADRLGTPNDYGVRTALNKLGLKPESDVQLLRLGGSAIQWSALQSKQIAASALTPPVSFKADAQGYTRLTDTYDLPYQNIGLVVRKAEVERRADIWLRLLTAVRRGINAWYENPQLAKSVVAKYTRDNDPVTLEKTYEFFTKQAGFNKDLTFSERGFEQILKFLGGTVLPAAKDAPVNQFYDTRIVEKLKR